MLLIGGHQSPTKRDLYFPQADSVVTVKPEAEVILPAENNPIPSPTINIQARETSPEQLVSFSKTLIGIPYSYGSTDPKRGFDCSGFITYTFNHFGIEVPRSSVEFANVGTEVDRFKAEPGDLILFTGTDSSIRVIGHMGIVVSNEEDKPLEFIHSTSGKKYGVTITELNEYYLGRFVKVNRVFPD